MTFKKIAVATAITLASIGVAQAQGMYVGLAYAQVSAESDGLSFKPSQVLGKVGYTIDQNWAIEGRLGLTSTSETVRFGGVDIETKISDSVGIYAKGTLPINEQFGLFGLIGYNKLTGQASARGVSASSSQDGSSYGLGAEFAATKSVGLTAEWVRHFSDTTSFAFGVNYKF